MIQDHPDFDGRYMRWCEHLNVHEIYMLGTNDPTYYICDDCGDVSPLVGDTSQWMPKLIGTRIDG